jgi:hypothetical protein
MQQASAGQPQSSDTLLSVAREVIPNLWKITVPIPFPLRTANMHALVGTDGWALIDTGMGTPDARAAFKESLQLAGLSIDKLRTIVLTHHHPDHVGLSGELQTESGATVYMHPIDEVSLQIIWSGMMPRRFERVSHFFQQHGLPPTKFWYTQANREGHHLEWCVMVQSRKTGSQFRPGFSIFPFLPLHKTRYGVHTTGYQCSTP